MCTPQKLVARAEMYSTTQYTDPEPLALENTDPRGAASCSLLLQLTTDGEEFKFVELHVAGRRDAAVRPENRDAGARQARRARRRDAEESGAGSHRSHGRGGARRRGDRVEYDKIRVRLKK